MPSTPPGLRYVDDARPGITRVGRGTGFSYHGPDGALVSDATRERCEALVIPPAWEDVWICPSANGHLQATGRDAKGRKQYRYHDDWTAHRNRLKFDKMVGFGEALPGIRARVEADLRQPALGREKVLALCVRLLDETLVRVGNEQYASENGSYGLTTVRDKHVSFAGSAVTFAFVGKSGKAHEITVDDARLARLVKACRDIPGYDLFQFYDEAGDKQDVESGHVNGYLQETTGEAFTAKDFRTWGGTVAAAEQLAAVEDASEPDACIVAAIQETAGVLGNTPAVCRQYYVHPDVLDAFRAGDLRDRVRRRNAGNTPDGLRPPEAAVLDLLRERAD
ncbi:DNA topoisomerase IB [Rubrivirga sp. IMCC45206]|uniref:DNA topoisomerase IB n=1 Tax=Rubrivirga sp. IMCC45206 TaxID=3391614 RepID=UPI0039901728